jgi:hypothetical protein
MRKEITRCEAQLGLLKHNFVEVAARRIKEIVLSIVEEAVLWSDLNKPMESQRITRKRRQKGRQQGVSPGYCRIRVSSSAPAPLTGS